MTAVQTLTLADFLLARYDEDESRGGTAATYRELAEALRNQGMPSAADWLTEQSNRVLAECDAKRQIVAEFTGAASWSVDPDCSHPGVYRLRAGTLADVLRLLALPYAEHEHYRQDWAL